MTNPTWQKPELIEIPKEVIRHSIDNPKIMEVRFNAVTLKWVRNNSKSYCFHPYGDGEHSITFTLKQ